MPTTVASQSIISCKRVVFRLTWCRMGRLMALPSDPCDICLLLWCCLDETHLCDESRLLLEPYSHRRFLLFIHDPVSPDCECGRSEEHTSELQSRQYLVC